MLQHLTDAQLDRKISDLENERIQLNREAMMSNGFMTYKGRTLNNVHGKQNSNVIDLRNANNEKTRRKNLIKKTSLGING